MQLEDLLSSLHSRATETRWGIGTAAQYLKSVESFIPESVKSQADWGTILKAAEKALTWCDEESADSDMIAKSFSDGTDLPDGFCGSFDCTLTSNRKDRDGDVLEPAGFKVDEQMPLLWQHIPVQPTGKFFQLLEQSEDRIRCKYGIVDTPFGRDNAVLIKCGVLRMSHGFKPFEFEPIQHKDAKDGVCKGWHVKRGEIREGSVVSIPSNVDGLIEAYSRGQLKTPVCQAWAKSYYDTRPLIVPVNIDLKVNGQPIGKAALPQHPASDAMSAPASPDNTKAASPKSLETKEGRVLSTANVGKLTQAKGLLDEVLAAGTDSEAKHSTGLATKNTDAMICLASKQFAVPNLENKTIGMEDDLEGSFEWIQTRLRKTAADYLRSRNVELSKYDGYVYLVATFADSAIVCAYNYERSTSPCFRVSWEMADSGPQWTGDVKEVSIKPQILEKAISALTTKDASVGGLPSSLVTAGSSKGETTIDTLAKQIMALAVKMPSGEGSDALEAAQNKLGEMREYLHMMATSELLHGG